MQGMGTGPSRQAEPRHGAFRVISESRAMHRMILTLGALRRRRHRQHARISPPAF